MAIQKEMCIIHVNNTITREELLEATMEVLYAILQSICDPILKDQVYYRDYEEIDNNKDIL